MDADLQELYQQVILDHHRRPRNFREVENCDRCAKGFNPLCGDRINIEVILADEGRTVVDVAFTGEGCAICTASASMMTECVKGMSVEKATRIFEGFHRLVTGEETSEDDTALLGKLAVFAGVREFPVRVKCASLPWHTLQAALHEERRVASTE